jgi:hypothetical protein
MRNPIKVVANAGHQGDVWIRRVDGLPKGSRKVSVPDKIIIALGEATGHMHVLNGESVDELFEFDRDLYAVMKSDPEVAGTITHDEHGTGVLLPGKTYKIERDKLREYVPGPVKERRVED